jgi:hypothetical protein
MKFKTLLLGTAAAFVVAGSAQAADLAVAESVEYVKVCDAYGAGYFYIPGSDVCLKIGGYAQFGVAFYDDSRFLNVGDPTGDTIPDYQASWRFATETSVNVTAKWMTDWGAATVYVDYRAVVDEANSRALVDNRLVFLDTGYLKIGGLKAGWDGSTYDWGFNGLIGFPTGFDHDVHQGQIQWSTTLGGLGFFLGLEDPRDNVGSSQYYTGDMPDIVAALTGSTGGFSWKWSVGVTDTIYGTGWGTQLGVGYSWGGSFVKLQAAVSNDAGAPYGAGLQPNNLGDTVWHVSGQGGIAWTAAFTTLLGAGYREQGGINEWEASAEADWTIAKGVQAGVAVLYTDSNFGDSATEVQARIKAGF